MNILEEKGKQLVISWFNTIDSTHKYLVSEIKNKNITEPVLIGADFQSDGIGSRGNAWIGKSGNIFISFCVKEKQLPKDLPLASTSIYFAWLAKEVLTRYGSKVWIKWPNDIYVQEKKIGGVLTMKTGDFIIGSMGINVTEAPPEFGVLDVLVSPREFANAFLEFLDKKITWKKVFSKYKIEYENHKEYFFHLGDEIKSLKDAKLCQDGSIEIENKRVYGLR
ncbi:biotin--[acetyl-CoA-carboxylase] ligase [Sulfurospirillum sp. 1612]|uniref:biotin--[acetyl-CoA-carboxylase] ligase n=1 Tax=Sulfurospirillum sp. 1612 TaxID=3094835 RepID=UPI002F9212AB